MGLDPESVVGMADHLEDGRHLGGDVGWLAEHVCVVELHGSHPGQAAQGSGGLLAELTAELGDAQRQLTVAALAGPVDQGVVRHRLGRSTIWSLPALIGGNMSSR